MGAGAAEVKLSPRVAEAWSIYEALPEPRSYKAVAEAMKITNGRAAAYCREAAVKLGKEDLLPRGGNGVEAAQVTPAEMMQAEVAKLTAQVQQAEARIEQAQADAGGFDPEGWRKAE